MFSLQQRNESFQAFLQTLNPAQREAVEQVEGPVLVIAGPGTGKTQLLTARIGNILLKTDARAQNILCLTFTDAGATAMRRRLLQRIGPEAQRVPISTFHSFCSRVIQENAEFFGKSAPEPVSELERIEIVRNLLLKLPAEHPLRAGKKEVFQFEEHLREWFSSMKKEGWTPGYVHRKCDEFLDDLPQNPAYHYQRNSKYFKKGEPKTAQIEEVKEKIARLKAAADLFPKYQHAMERAGRYEYEDMLLWVTRAFEKNESLLRSYQERFQYILVDEFQDTNGAQFQLLQQLLDFWETPNIFIVGDDDQSIFEFQGARLHNLEIFRKEYHKGLKTIILSENYRATQPLLDAASRLIELNLLRAVNLPGANLHKELKAVRSPQKPQEPQILRFPNRLQESIYISSQIEQLIRHGIPPAEIAVLYARHRQADVLQSLLEKKGIAYQTKRPINILDLPPVRQFISLLSYLQEELEKSFSGEHRLFRLFHAPFFKLPELDLARLSLAAYTTLRPDETEPEELYLKVGTAQKQRRYWRTLLSEPDTLAQMAIEAPESFLFWGKRLNTWISDAQNLPPLRLIERLYEQSGLLDWSLAQAGNGWWLQVWHTIMEFVREEALRNPRLNLQRLLALLDSMDDNRLALPLRQANQQQEAVQLLTAHASKGLEFAHVFMLDCTEDTWDKNSGNNRGRFFLPDTLTRSGEEDQLEARRRLFYVAMTRAKDRLQISFAQNDDSGKNLLQSRFIDETELEITDSEAPAAEILKAQTLILREAEKPVIALLEKERLNQFLADFSLSITALNRYLRCPLAFYYEDVLKVPGAPSEYAVFGLVMHGTLQQFALRMKAHKKYEWPSPEALQKIFIQEMEKQKGFFSENGFIQFFALGKEHLRRISLEQVPHWPKRLIVERRIDRVEMDGVPLTGILDKIEWLDGSRLRIVDYKTGSPDLKKTAPPSENQALGGEYWRQLAFYQILVEQARIYPETVQKTAISWLEPDKKGTYPVVEISFRPEELQFVGQLIQETYANIHNGNFATGCGKTDCSWCNMQREKQYAPATERAIESELDDSSSG